MRARRAGRGETTAGGGEVRREWSLRLNLTQHGETYQVCDALEMFWAARALH
ncbi:unnamed protein product [Spirodela intermedia]|uniref:Uncharacterized protein n=1 Tax=Spirodela intermedia TaxID=51605 RepID=A0A7I8KLY7_SPIIN|nr:unnamed protein product [Spirodela intermedia]